jgi:formylglycine-generating enzyme required for sulfatase activity
MPAFDITWGDAARFCNWLDNGQPSGGENLSTTESGAYYINGGTSTALLMEVASPPHSGPGAPQYFLPTEVEWYKAAYFDPSLNGGSGGYWTYATKSNTPPDNSLALAATEANDANYWVNHWTDPTNLLTPVGLFAASPSAYGTFDQSGDDWQWEETIFGSGGRGQRGGSWDDDSRSLASSVRNTYQVPSDGQGAGFRVAGVAAPAPEPGSLALLLAGGSCLAAFAWRRRRRSQPFPAMMKPQPFCPCHLAGLKRNEGQRSRNAERWLDGFSG